MAQSPAGGFQPSTVFGSNATNSAISTGFQNVTPPSTGSNGSSTGNPFISQNANGAPNYNPIPVQNPTQANPGTMDSVAPISGNNVTAAQSGASTYNPANANSAGYNSTNANSASWNVDPSQLTSNQLSGILQSNSPLMGQASLAADQSMNARGLLNSSMTGGAEEASMINAATPIAQANANTLSAAASLNTQNQQQTNLTNAAASNTASQFNAGNQQQANLANQSAQNTAGQFNASQTQQSAQTNQSATNSANQFNSQLNLTAAQSNQGAALQQATTKFNAALQTAMQATGGQITLAQQSIASNSAATVAQLQGTYSNLISSNNNVASAYNQLQSGIASILSNPNVSNPQQEVSTLVNNFSAYANSQQAIGSVPIAQYFQPSGTNSGGTGGSGGAGTGGGGKK